MAFFFQKQLYILYQFHGRHFSVPCCDTNMADSDTNSVVKTTTELGLRKLFLFTYFKCLCVWIHGSVRKRILIYYLKTKNWFLPNTLLLIFEGSG